MEARRLGVKTDGSMDSGRFVPKPLLVCIWEHDDLRYYVE